MGNIFKKIADVAGDFGKGVAKIVASPVNAATGHEFNPTMNTKVGQALNWAGDVIEDTQTKAINTVSGGLLKKAGLYDGTVETKFGNVLGTVAGVGGLVLGASKIAGVLSKSDLLKSVKPVMDSALKLKGLSVPQTPQGSATAFMNGVVIPAGYQQTGDPTNDIASYIQAQMQAQNMGVNQSDLNDLIASQAHALLNESQTETYSMFKDPIIILTIAGLILTIFLVLRK